MNALLQPIRRVQPTVGLHQGEFQLEIQPSHRQNCSCKKQKTHQLHINFLQGDLGKNLTCQIPIHHVFCTDVMEKMTLLFVKFALSERVFSN
jgi:hypothetical protein